MTPTPCPSDITIARHAAAPAADQAIADHVAACAPCTATLAELRVIRATLGGAPLSGLPGDQCLDEAAVARIVDGQAAAAELAHAARCATCRGLIAEVAAAVSAGPVAAEIERLEAPGRAGWRRRALGIGGIAAAAVLAIVVTRQLPRDGGAEATTFRDAPTGASAAPTAVFPVDSAVSRPIELRWTSAPGATQYRVTVFDAEGSIVWNGETGDTAVAVPATVRLDGDAAYWWRVDARVGFDRWLHSEVTPFAVSRPKAR